MSEPISRRKAIAGAAVGGAALWAAPSIVSVSAASAATVPPAPDLVLNGSFEASTPGLTASNWVFA